MDLALSPHGHLFYQRPLNALQNEIIAIADTPPKWSAAFEESSANGLLSLTTQWFTAPLPPAATWWREFAMSVLTRLCHSTRNADGLPSMPPPFESSYLAELSLTAPPMQGLEYLRPETLQMLGEELLQLILERMATHPQGPQSWLAEQHSAFRLLGRVTFHLAENKKDPDRPFAFLATYTETLNAEAKPQYLPLARALEQYAGAKNNAALLNLLAPIHLAAQKSLWVKGLLESKAIFQPQMWKPNEALALLKEIPILEESGLMVRIPNWWKGSASRPKVKITVGRKKQGVAGLDSLLDFKMEVVLDGASLNATELKAIQQAGQGLILLKGQWVEIDSTLLEETLAHWKEVKRISGKDGVSFLEGMRMLAGMRGGTGNDSLVALDTEMRQWCEVVPGDWLRETIEGLGSPSQSVQFNPGEGLSATLRPYQAEGVRWLWLMQHLGLGACLADDMGLGKTIQVIALLLRLKQTTPPNKTHQPSLLIAPTSLLANWQAEVARFAPQLKVDLAHPAFLTRNSSKPRKAKSSSDTNRTAGIPSPKFHDCDLVITSYGMLHRLPLLQEQTWNLVVLDEAQAIKNPDALQTRTVKSLRSRSRIALSGTPIENHLSDLWSLFDFLNPGLLGSYKRFTQFAKSLQRDGTENVAPLRRLIRLYLLRRLKTDKKIIADLPDKTEVPTWCMLSKTQAALYQQQVRELADRIEKTDGIQRRGLILAYLMRFKQICNHPSQLLGDGQFRPEDSGKFARLAAICEEIAERQEKALIFTQFREMTAPLAHFLNRIFRRQGLILSGETSVKKRREFVEAFQKEEGPPFFVLSLKAGGTGLNLTAASHVIHFDRWWNPAVENQATDRAFRIGQHRNVLVHPFICKGTVEERIDQLITEKKQLAGEILGEGSSEQLLTEMNNEELLRFVALDIDAIFVD